MREALSPRGSGDEYRKIKARGYLDTGHVSHRIGPRINAAGRLNRLDMVQKLLVLSEEGVGKRKAGEIRDEANGIARKLSRYNDERKKLEDAVFEEGRPSAH